LCRPFRPPACSKSPTGACRPRQRVCLPSGHENKRGSSQITNNWDNCSTRIHHGVAREGGKTASARTHTSPGGPPRAIGPFRKTMEDIRSGSVSGDSVAWLVLRARPWNSPGSGQRTLLSRADHTLRLEKFRAVSSDAVNHRRRFGHLERSHRNLSLCTLHGSCGNNVHCAGLSCSCGSLPITFMGNVPTG